MQSLFTRCFTYLIILGLFFTYSQAKANVNTSSINMYGAVLNSDNDEQGVLSNKNIRIINLGPIINHDGLDYAPTISADGRTLYFVTENVGSKLNKDGDPSHDFWSAKKGNRLDTVFGKPKNIDLSTELGDKSINTSFNEGAASIAADGQSLFFTACERPDGLGSCDLYRTTIEGDKWGRPVNLGRSVNSKYFDSQPSIAPDQSRIYFASGRPSQNHDADESTDIWYSDWDDDMEEWKPAINLKAINTPGKDWSPFIAADNQTLFFASDGHIPNFGGLDFYMTKYDPTTDSWSKPQNLGKPINTEEDESFITLPASGDVIYFSSSREDVKGAQGNYDVLMAFVPSFFRAINVTGTVIDECSGEFIPAVITVKNPITGREYKDSLTNEHSTFKMIVSNTDYGDPRDSVMFVDLEVTAFNPKYGSKTAIQRVEKPAKTEEKKDAGAIANEYNVKVTLGQRPVIAAEMAEANYITRVKAQKPELATFRGLVMEEVQTWDLYPLLNYIFFDHGKSEIPSRYILFKDKGFTGMFTDTTIKGGTLDKYYHLLNIYGFRMNMNPKSKIEIVGCNDGKTKIEKRAGLSKERATNVYNYLKDIWGISEDRMKLVFRNRPKHPTKSKDPEGIVENRRVEIICKDWDIMKPVFETDPKTFPQPSVMDLVLTNGIEDAIVAKRRVEITRNGKPWNTFESEIGLEELKYNWNWQNTNGEYPEDEVPFTVQLVVTTKSGAECKSEPVNVPVMQVNTRDRTILTGGDSTRENYNLILFPFDSPNAGKINERIMRDYVYGRCKPTSKIEVTGHTDVVGLEKHNKRLSERRAKTVYKGLMKKTKGKFGELTTEGVGEENAIYTNALPEGRFYNRTVNVKIWTPVAEYKKK